MRRRRSAGWAVVGVGLVLLGAGGLAAGAALGASLDVAVVGGDTPVNAGGGDPADVQAHNSPAVVRDPTDGSTVVVANRIDLPDFSCALHVSRDGGQSWDHRSLPVPDGEGDHCYAPDVAFGPQGTLYVAYVTLSGRGNTPHAVWLMSSDDGGRSLSEPSRIGDELWFQVRLAADPNRPGRLYLTWLDVDDTATFGVSRPGQPIRSKVSDDGGETWSEPVRVSPEARERVVAPSPAIGPDGTWHVAYLDLRGDRLDYRGAHAGRGGPPYRGTWGLVVARSGDGGRTWSETAVAELTPTERFIVFLPPFPSVAVHGDRVYVAFTGGRAADDPAAGADVFLWASPDGGRTWQDAVRVNHTPPGDGSRQYLPRVSVGPTGRVDVVYYDRRGDPENVLNEVALQSSVDGGETFTDRVVTSDAAFDSGIGFGASRDMAELGSRLGLASTADRALAVWADTRAGTRASGKQDLMQATVAFSGGSLWPPLVLTAIRLAGAAMVLVGVGVLATWVISRRPRPGTPAAGRGS